MRPFQYILLVEDNPYDVELTISAFQRNNLANDIIVLRDGEEALEFLYRRGQYESRPLEHPTLILLDLKMPKVDGIEVLAQIKSDPNLSDIPVVVLTSSVEEQDMVNSYHLGAFSYMEKPLDFKQFHQAMRKLGLYWGVFNPQNFTGTRPAGLVS